MRTVIVTGARGGIGEATAKKFLELGDQVYGADLALNETPHDFVEVICDVSDPDAVSGLVERVVNETGRIDVLVNNAGIRLEKDVINTTIEEWDRMMAVNLTSVFLGCKFALPHMLKQSSGAIVNVASVSGLNPLPNRAAYCANKAGVIGLTRQMALQYSRKGVRVNAVCPGATMTPFARDAMAKTGDPAAAEAGFSARMPIGRFGEPEEIANSIAYLASEEASFITGAILDVDGGNNLPTAHVTPGTY
jgi:NAD(P)-dependent dehydrogenase (short-subunit alcohol dehydrogenase family)